MEANVDPKVLEAKVKAMYERVALEPAAEFHFEMGRALAERLGYESAILDTVPAEAIDSFAGVGHHFGLAQLIAGESVLDLGSGSGLDTFVAARLVGPSGRVVGVDMTEAQRAKAERLRVAHGFGQVEYVDAYIERVPFEDARFDCVMSNGVLNLAQDKAAVFREAARLLRPGGRLAISDIVTGAALPESVVCNADLWAACIGGAMEREAYQQAIEESGLRIRIVQPNPEYRFLSDRADGAAQRFEVQSISLLAVKE
jgi:SAM-dependent methyltransferase